MDTIKYINVEEIKTDSKLIKTINFKPVFPQYACLVFGILAIIFLHNIFAKIIGAFFIIMAVIVITLVKDHKSLSVYEKGVVIYNSDDDSKAYYLPYSDILEWKVDHDNGNNAVVFKHNNGIKYISSTFQASKAYNCLMETCPEKEERVIQAKKNKETPFANPIDTIKNIINKKKK